MNRAIPPWLALCSLLLGLPEAARASGTVTNCTESDLGIALRGGGLVVLACDSTISLSTPMIVAKDIVLDATGHHPVITSSQTTNAGPLFLVQPGASLTLRSVTISGVQLTTAGATNGVDALPALGAALYIDRGLVTLDGCTFTNQSLTGGAGANAVNPGDNGGRGALAAGAAVYNTGGQLLVTNCVFAANRAVGGSGGAGAAGQIIGPSDSGGHGGDGGAGSGAAIYNTGNGLVSIYSSVFSSNQVVGSSAGLGGAGAGILAFHGAAGHSGAGLGAAIFNDQGQIVIVNSTFVANTGTGAAGQAGYAGDGTEPPGDGSDGGSALGAGLFNNSGTVTLTNCTFVSNSLMGGSGGPGGSGSTGLFGSDGGDGGQGGDALGSGLYNASRATAIVVNNTFTDNEALGGLGGAGGPGTGIGHHGEAGAQGNQAGAALFNAGGVLRLRNSILANSTGAENAGGAITDEGFNLSSDASAGFTAAGSRNQIDPLLGSYSTAGGLVPTMTLSTNSPAINAITAPGGNGAPAFDQRGALRVEPFDIGAYEPDGRFVGLTLQAELATSRQVVLSWPAAGNALLQTTTNVVLTNRWLLVTNQPTPTPAGLRVLSVSPTNPASFYRLVTP